MKYTFCVFIYITGNQHSLNHSKSLQQFTPSSTLKKRHEFLATINIYRPFTSHCAQILPPLTNVLIGKQNNVKISQISEIRVSIRTLNIASCGQSNQKIIWPDKNKDITNWIKTCQTSQRTKVQRYISTMSYRLNLPSQRIYAYNH